MSLAAGVKLGGGAAISPPTEKTRMPHLHIYRLLKEKKKKNRKYFSLESRDMSLMMKPKSESGLFFLHIPRNQDELMIIIYIEEVIFNQCYGL